MRQRMADPGDLPGLKERIDEIMGDVAAETSGEGPRHQHREKHPTHSGHNDLDHVLARQGRPAV